MRCDERTTSHLLRGSRRRTGRPPFAGDGAGRRRGSVHGEGGATATARWETARWEAATAAGGGGRRRRGGRRLVLGASAGGAGRREGGRAGRASRAGRRRSRSVYWKWEASISRGLGLQFGGPCKMGVQIGSQLELSFSPKLLKNRMGTCLETWAGDALIMTPLSKVRDRL